MSGNFKNIMSQLKISKDEQNTNQSNVKSVEKTKNLTLKANEKYVIRFIPYITEANEPKTVKEHWYHYYNNQKYTCQLGCELCASKVKKTLQKLVNVQLIETTDKRYKESEYYIMSLTQSLYAVLDNYEKTNSKSLFDVYSSSDVILNPTEIINSYNTKVLSFDNSIFTELETPLSSNINDYDDEKIISFLKEFTYDLDKEVSLVPKYKEIVSTPVVEKETIKLVIPKQEEIVVNTDVLKHSISAMKNQIEEDMKDLNISDDYSEFEKTKPVKKPRETKKETPVITQKENTNVTSQDEYIMDFLNSIETDEK